MTLSTASPAAPRVARLISTTLAGFVLALTGLSIAYLAVATSLISSLVPGISGQRASVGIAPGIWAFSLVAGGALLAAGANRLARILAEVRTAHRFEGPAAAAIGTGSSDLAVVANVVPRDGRPIPELVIGSFGAVVVRALPPSSRLRDGSLGWEERTGDGWRPTEDPLDAAMRDAERVRRWLGGADLEFVVRVYAVLVVEDRVVPRSPACAVVSAHQIRPWLESLPRQRTLTTGRRARLLAVVQSGADTGGW